MAIELGYAERTSNMTTTSTTPVDVTGLSVTVDVGARPILVKFDCGAIGSSAATGIGEVAILEDGVWMCKMGWVGVGTGSLVGVHREIRRNPSAGTHTYKVQFDVTGFGSGTLTLY